MSESRTKSIQSIFNKIAKLSTEKKEELSEYVKQQIFKDKNTYLQKITEHARMSCPRCNSVKRTKNGIVSNIQRHKCKSCGKNYSDSTGQSIHWVHFKDKWYEYIEMLFNGQHMSCRDTALELEVNHKTTFRWRHKVLNGLNIALEDDFKGIIEMDDLHFVFSEKGRRGLPNPSKRGKPKGKKKRGDGERSVKVLATMDRIDTLKLDVVRIGRLKANDIKRTCMDNHIDLSSNILTSDNHPSINSFAKKIGIRHETFYAKNHCRAKVYHVNTVNEKANRLNNLVNIRLKGTSTKYLQNYMNWFKMLELQKFLPMNYFDWCFTNIESWFRWQKREKIYEKFITDFSEEKYTHKTNFA
jgi:transposase-like protein